MILWNKQIDGILAEVFEGIGFSRRIRKLVPKNTLTPMMLCILPQFDYCSLVWNNCSDYLLDKVQKMQDRPARIVTGRPYEVRSDDVLKELNCQSLKKEGYAKKVYSRRKLETIFTRKA